MATRKTAPKAAPQAEQKSEEYSTRKVDCKGYAALNVRKSPSTAAPVIGELENGAEVMAGEQKRGWCKLESGGFVRSCFLA